MEMNVSDRRLAKNKFLNIYNFLFILAIFPVIPGLIGGFLLGQSRHSPILLARRFPATSALLGRRILVVGLLALMVFWPIALFFIGEVLRFITPFLA